MENVDMLGFPMTFFSKYALEILPFGVSNNLILRHKIVQLAEYCYFCTIKIEPHEKTHIHRTVFVGKSVNFRPNRPTARN